MRPGCDYTVTENRLKTCLHSQYGSISIDSSLVELAAVSVTLLPGFHPLVDAYEIWFYGPALAGRHL